MTKDTYQIKVKSESRNKWMKFLRGRIKDKKHRLKVLCFPGPEALEIFEVYDKLGVPRQNITCLERDKEAYDLISSLNLGCNLVHADLFNYIHTNKNSQFDIISLDFTGQLGSCGPELFHLVREGFLAEKCFIFTNFSAAREQDYTKAYYLLGATQYKAIQDAHPNDEDSREKAKSRLKKYQKGFSMRIVESHEEVFQELFSTTKEEQSLIDSPNGILDQQKNDDIFPLPSGIMKKQKNGRFEFDFLTDDIEKRKLLEAPVKELRDVAIWHMVREALINGKANPLHKIAYKQFKYVIDKIKDNSKEGFPEHYSPKLISSLQNMNSVVSRKGEELPDAAKQILDHIIVETLKDVFCVQFSLSESSNQFIATGRIPVKTKGKVEMGDFYFSVPVFSATNFLLFQLYELLTDARFVKRTSSYKYVSDNGMPMYCDMFELGKVNLNFIENLINRKAEKVEDFFESIALLPPLEIGKILKKMEESCMKLEVEIVRSAPPRIDLGRESQANPKIIPIPPPSPPVPEPLEVETEDYIELKKAEALAFKRTMPDLTSKDIGLAINVNPRKVAAWLAHLTMGTYVKKEKV